MDFTSIIKGFTTFISRNSTTMLKAGGATLAVFALYETAKAAPRAKEIINEEEAIREKPLTIPEKAKLTWKEWVPPVIFAMSSASCFIGANQILARRRAALAAALTLSEATLEAFKNETKKEISKESYEKVQKAVAETKAKINNPDKEIRSKNMETPAGDEITWFYDTTTGQRFKSTINEIQKAINKINYNLISEDVSLGDYCYELDLKKPKFAEDLIWENQLYSNGKPPLEISPFGSIVIDNKPHLILDIYPTPTAKAKRY